MGSRYKKGFEIEWEGKSLADIKLKTLHMKSSDNLSKLAKGKLGRTKRRSK